MTLPSRIPSEQPPPEIPLDSSTSWRELQLEDHIQFEEVVVPLPEPREPGWLDQVFEWLAALFSPLGNALVAGWPVLQWILLALAVGALLLLAWRIFSQSGFGGNKAKASQSGHEVLWAPDQDESLALLSDADALAAAGRFDEATHLLLQRSVGQIAAARPDWVAPSSTARELVALPKLSEPARAAFHTITERVERSLFALKSLDRSDWETARQAYADFALSRIEQQRSSQ